MLVQGIQADQIPRPFSAALVGTKHGAVIVLDGNAEPMRRIWCLYEVGLVNVFGKTFELIIKEDGLTKRTTKR